MSKVWVLLKSKETENFHETKVSGVFSVYEEAYLTAIKEILIWCEEEGSINMEEIYTTLKEEERELIKLVSYGNSIPLNLEEEHLSSIFLHLDQLVYQFYQRNFLNHTNFKGKNVDTEPITTKKDVQLVRFKITSHLVDVYEQEDEDFEVQTVSEAPGEFDFSEEDEVELDEEDTDLEMDVDEDELNGLLEDLEHGPEHWLELARIREGTEAETITPPKPGSSRS